jgi:RimJ/RimL family protein N-acetyltransferase
MITPNLLRGEKVRLTAVTSQDASVLARWWADVDFLRLYDSLPAYPKTEDQLVRRMEAGQDGRENFLFAIRPLATEELIGLFELDGIVWSHRTSGLSIGIGSPEDRRQGYAADAMRVGLNFAFNELNLYRVYLTVFSYNEAAIALYEKLGFTREGVAREHLERDGRRFDMIHYGILRHEWCG